MANLAASWRETVRIEDLPTGLYIAGEWREAASQKRVPVNNPADEEVLATIACGDVEDALGAVDAAAATLKQWSSAPPRQRAEILLAAYRIMMDRIDWLATLITIENGKSLNDARGEVRYAAEFFRWYSEEAVRINGEVAIAPGGANRMIVQHQPIGVCLLITPWNFPAAMATRKIGPALAAGCTCILKPALETPLTALAIAEILAEAGVPGGVVNVVNTDKPGLVTAAMLRDPRLRKLSFTGSTAVGRSLLAEASHNVVSCSMELGGNAPFIVFEDADIDAAIEGAMIAKMRNAGEACTAANRFFIHEAVMEEFATKLTARMQALEVGEGWLPETACGPLVNEKSLRKVSKLVDDAIDKGALVLTGGQPIDRRGYFYPPTVLANVGSDAMIFREEVFGPVAALFSFTEEAEAIRLANDTEYGLVSYVYTGDFKRGLRVSEALEAGMIALNRGLVSEPAAPFGGVKQSGLGREGSHHGLHEFMEVKYIATEW